MARQRKAVVDPKEKRMQSVRLSAVERQACDVAAEKYGMEFGAWARAVLRQAAGLNSPFDIDPTKG